MNILIVCIQGMTSGVMANRLNDLALEKKEDYRFKACGWAHVSEHVSWADVCLITPQAKGYLDVIQPFLAQNHIRVFSVSTLDLAFNRIPYTYENIVYLVKTAKSQSQTDKFKEVFFWFFFYFVEFGFIHILSNLTTGFLHDYVFYPLNFATWECISFYFCTKISRLALKESNVSKAVSILLGPYIILLSTPAMLVQNDETHIFTQSMTQGLYGPKWLIYYVVITIITTLSLRFALQKDQEMNMRSKLNWLEMGFPIVIQTTIFLVVRFIVILCIM